LRPSRVRCRGGGPLAAARCHKPTSSPLRDPPQSLPFPPLQHRFVTAVVKLNLLQHLGITSSSPGADRASSILDLASPILSGQSSGSSSAGAKQRELELA
jgi:hypothetical protein